MINSPVRIISMYNTSIEEELLEVSTLRLDIPELESQEALWESIWEDIT